MNRSFRTIWSDVHNGYVVAPESALGGGKKSRIAVMAPALLALFAWSGAVSSADFPAGGQVVAGSGALVTDGSKLTIHQATNRLAIDWQSFNIGQGKTVEFVQPSSSAVALNRVLGTDVSVIQGALQANGQVFLVNPNGVLFTPSAQINVGGIVASTLNIKTDDFMAGNYRFEGTNSNAIVNKGSFGATGKVNLQPGANFSTLLGSDGAVTNFTVLAQGTTPFTNNSLNNSSGKWALGADVDFTSVGVKENTFVSDTNNGFVLEGLGHTLSKISMSAPRDWYHGFFRVNRGVIRNLVVDSFNLSQTNNVTSVGFVGMNTSTGVLERVKITGNPSAWQTGSILLDSRIGQRT